MGRRNDTGSKSVAERFGPFVLDDARPAERGSDASDTSTQTDNVSDFASHGDQDVRRPPRPQMIVDCFPFNCVPDEMS